MQKGKILCRSLVRAEGKMNACKRVDQLEFHMWTSLTEPGIPAKKDLLLVDDCPVCVNIICTCVRECAFVCVSLERAYHLVGV